MLNHTVIIFRVLLENMEVDASLCGCVTPKLTRFGCCQAEGLLKPLREVEMPLVPVLAQMEAVGVAVDPTIFAKHKVCLTAA